MITLSEWMMHGLRWLLYKNLLLSSPHEWSPDVPFSLSSLLLFQFLASFLFFVIFFSKRNHHHDIYSCLVIIISTNHSCDSRNHLLNKWLVTKTREKLKHFVIVVEVFTHRWVLEWESCWCWCSWWWLLPHHDDFTWIYLYRVLCFGPHHEPEEDDHLNLHHSHHDNHILLLKHDGNHQDNQVDEDLIESLGHFWTLLNSTDNELDYITLHHFHLFLLLLPLFSMEYHQHPIKRLWWWCPKSKWDMNGCMKIENKRVTIIILITC